MSTKFQAEFFFHSPVSEVDRDDMLAAVMRDLSMTQVVEKGQATAYPYGVRAVLVHFWAEGIAEARAAAERAANATGIPAHAPRVFDAL